MDVDVRKWLPWNWFRREQEQGGSEGSVPVRERGDVPIPYADDAFTALHRELDRLLARVLGEAGGPLARGFELPGPRPGAAPLKPRVDIKETPAAYTLTVEVPGVDADDVRVELEERTLVVSGEKRHERARDDESYHWVERSYGAFRRMLSLPEDADEAGIDARFERGVLTIEVPRKASAKPEQRRRIEVRSG